MQKILIYLGGSILTIALLFGGGFLAGRFTADKQSGQASSDDSKQISRIVELTREYITTRAAELSNREANVANREKRISDREASISARESRLRELEKSAASDRGDLAELAEILSKINRLSTTR